MPTAFHRCHSAAPRDAARLAWIASAFLLCMVRAQLPIEVLQAAAGAKAPLPALFPQTLPHCTTTPMRDAIVGLADNYILKHVGSLVLSVRHVARPEDVDVLLLTNVVDPHLVKWAKVLSVQLVPFFSAKNSHAVQTFQRSMPTAGDFGVYRFFHYLAIAETRCNRGYVFLDTRDIFWQRNLFALTPRWWWTDGVVMTAEKDLFGDPQRKVTFKDNAELKCLFGGIDGFGIDGLGGINITSKQMLCSGVFGGGGPALRTFLRDVAIWLLRIGHRRCRRRWIPDQLLMNAMVHRDGVRNAVVSSFDDGLVYHQITHMSKARCEPFPNVTNGGGTKVAAVVHHIDRSPHLLHVVSNFVAARSNGTLHPDEVFLALNPGLDYMDGLNVSELRRTGGCMLGSRNRSAHATQSHSAQMPQHYLNTDLVLEVMF